MENGNRGRGGPASTHLGASANAIAVGEGAIEGAEKVQGLRHCVDPALVSFLQGPQGPQRWRPTRQTDLASAGPGALGQEAGCGDT